MDDLISASSAVTGSEYVSSVSVVSPDRKSNNPALTQLSDTNAIVKISKIVKTFLKFIINTILIFI